MNLSTRLIFSFIMVSGTSFGQANVPASPVTIQEDSIHSLLKDIENYKNIGEFRTALEKYKLLIVLKDSLHAQSQKIKFAELQELFETKRKQEDLARLVREKKINTILIVLLGAILTSVVIAIALVFARSRIRQRKEKEIEEKESQRLQSEIMFKKLQEEELNNDLEFKTRELESFTINLVRKNELLEEIKSRVEEIKNVQDEEIKKKLSRLVSNINFSIRIDREWTTFRTYFDQVHQGFFDILSARFPVLNPNDLKLCALLSLNMSAKQIATILDITPESAKVARHRIRKKLGLASDEDISTFLNTVELN